MTPHGSLEGKIVEKALQEPSRPNVRAVSSASCKLHGQFLGEPVLKEQGRSSGGGRLPMLWGQRAGGGQPGVLPIVQGVLLERTLPAADRCCDSCFVTYNSSSPWDLMPGCSHAGEAETR